MDIELKCSKCGQALVVSAEYAGREAECPKCNNPVLIPVWSKPQSPPIEQKPFINPSASPSNEVSLLRILLQPILLLVLFVSVITIVTMCLRGQYIERKRRRVEVLLMEVQSTLNEANKLTQHGELTEAWDSYQNIVSSIENLKEEYPSYGVEGFRELLDQARAGMRNTESELVKTGYAKHRGRWMAQEQKKKEQEKKRKQFEEEQRAKGLIKHEGKWVSPDQIAEIYYQEALDYRKRGKGLKPIIRKFQRLIDEFPDYPYMGDVYQQMARAVTESKEMKELIDKSTELTLRENVSPPPDLVIEHVRTCESIIKLSRLQISYLEKALVYYRRPGAKSHESIDSQVNWCKAMIKLSKEMIDSLERSIWYIKERALAKTPKGAAKRYVESLKSSGVISDYRLVRVWGEVLPGQYYIEYKLAYVSRGGFVMKRSYMIVLFRDEKGDWHYLMDYPIQ